jgi:polysaccharide export outer membrane protein
MISLLPRLALACATLSLTLLVGCAGPAAPKARANDDLDPLVLTAGDVLKISFPGSPNLDTSQAIRRDGRINLEIIGEVKAVGVTPAEFEKELLKLYSPHLVTKDVKVSVVTSTFSVFVTGAVLRPGKLQLERAVTAFEAVMEAGGFDVQRANMKEISIIRNVDGISKTYKVNLKAVMDGKATEQFRLQAFDTVYVPEKFQWF